jgi:hypothetical protein
MEIAREVLPLSLTLANTLFRVDIERYRFAFEPFALIALHQAMSSSSTDRLEAIGDRVAPREPRLRIN